MANPDSVGQNTQDNFGNYRIATVGPVSLAATGNAVAVLPILRGGTGGTTEYIIRRITVGNLSNSAGGSTGNAATVTVSVGTSNDGANLVANAQTTTNLNGSAGFADLTLSATANANCYTANALFLNITANVLANHAAFVSVYGDIVTF